MSWFSNAIKGGVEGVAGGMGDLITTAKELITDEPSPEKRLAHLEKIIAWGQQEARHKSILIAGWRPFIGWVCGIGFAFNVIVHPLFLWLNSVFWQIPNPPALDIGLLVSTLGGMLGMGGIRSYDKKHGQG